MSHPAVPADHPGLPGREEALFRLCFGAAPQAALIFELNPDGSPAKISECNEAAERLLRYSRGELLQRTVLELTEGDHRRDLTQALLDLLMMEAGTWEATVTDSVGQDIAVTVDGVLFDDEGRRATMIQLLTRTRRPDRPQPAAPDVLFALFSRHASAFLESRPGDDIYPLIAAGLADLVGDASVLITSCNEREGYLSVRETMGPVRHWIRFARTLGVAPDRIPLPSGGYYMDIMHRGELVQVEEGLYDMCFGAVPRVVCRSAEKMFGISFVYGMGICRRGVLHGSVVILTRRGERLENPALVEAYANLAAVALHRQQAVDDLAESQARLLRVERLQAMGQLASGLAHDFNNLLTLILGNGDLVERTLPKEDPRRRMVQKIISAARRAASLTTQLLAFSRRDPGVVERVELDPILAELEPILRGLAGERHRLVMRLHTGPGDAEVLIHPSQVEQIAMNLVSNACDAMPEGGEVTLETRRRVVQEALPATSGTVPPGDYVCLSVSDTGIGMTTETEQQAFEPFFTTKPRQKGTGLGLSTVYGIVEQSRGHIQIETAPQAGTRVTVYLPHHVSTSQRAVVASTAAAPPRLEPSPAEANGISVLLVEDQELVRDVVGLMLKELGYRVLVASDGDEALALEASHEGALELLVTDVVMPGLQGPELAERFVQRRPDTRVLFISGCTDGATLSADALTSPTAFLAKPFNRSELEATLVKLRGQG